MKTTVCLRSPVAVLLTLTVTSVMAHGANPYDDGWVSHVDDQQMEICYQSAPPAVGQTLQILKTSFIVPNKGQPRQQFTPGGTARITGTAADAGCVIAELTDGSARRSDHARP